MLMMRSRVLTASLVPTGQEGWLIEMLSKRRLMLGSGGSGASSESSAYLALLWPAIFPV